MLCATVRGRKQHENNIDWRFIDRIERNWLREQEHGAAHLVHPVQFGMRNRNATAKTGGTEAFAFGQPLDNFTRSESVDVLRDLPKLLKKLLLVDDLYAGRNCFRHQQVVEIIHKFMSCGRTFR